jgi:dsRNA-specific ribonuclease
MLRGRAEIYQRPPDLCSPVLTLNNLLQKKLRSKSVPVMEIEVIDSVKGRKAVLTTAQNAFTISKFSTENFYPSSYSARGAAARGLLHELDKSGDLAEFYEYLCCESEGMNERSQADIDHKVDPISVNGTEIERKEQIIQGNATDIIPSHVEAPEVISSDHAVQLEEALDEITEMNHDVVEWNEGADEHESTLGSTTHKKNEFCALNDMNKHTPNFCHGFEPGSFQKGAPVDCYANIVDVCSDSGSQLLSIVIFSVHPTQFISPIDLLLPLGKKARVSMKRGPYRILVDGDSLLSQALWTINLFDTILEQKLWYNKLPYILGFLQQSETVDLDHLARMMPLQRWDSFALHFTVENCPLSKLAKSVIINHAGMFRMCYVEAVITNKGLLEKDILANTLTSWNKGQYPRDLDMELQDAPFVLRVRQLPRVFNAFCVDSSINGELCHVEYAVPSMCRLLPLSLNEVRTALLLPSIMSYTEAYMRAIDFGDKLSLHVHRPLLFEAMTSPIVNKTNNYETLLVIGRDFMNLAVTIVLYLQSPILESCEISERRAAMVSKNVLDDCAARTNISQFVNSTPYSATSYVPPHSTSMFTPKEEAGHVLQPADCVLSIIGACYHSYRADSAFDALVALLDSLCDFTSWRDVRARIQEQNGVLHEICTRDVNSQICMSEISRLQNFLEYRFNYSHYLLQALTHPSATSRPFGDQRRLSVLGYSILKFCLVQHCFYRYDNLTPNVFHSLDQFLLNMFVMGSIADNNQLDSLIIHNSKDLLALLTEFKNRSTLTFESTNLNLSIKPPEVLRYVLPSPEL